MKTTKKLYLLITSVLLLGLVVPGMTLAQEEVACAKDVVVQAGDWISTIAQTEYGDPSLYPALVTATNAKAATDSTYTAIADPNVIEPGWKICVPGLENAQAMVASSTPAPSTAASTTVQGTVEVSPTVQATVEISPTVQVSPTLEISPTVEISATVTPAAESTPSAAATPITPSASNSPRLRPLDFAAFEQALAAFTPERATAIGALVTDATIPQVQAAMAAGDLTAEELTLYFLARIRQYDETLRTMIELNPEALAQAKAADARRAAGNVLGPLDGIPLTLKDNIQTAAPMHTTAGAEILLDHVADDDAPLVQNLRAAGAVIFGKANLSELAGSISVIPGASAVGGLTMNPHGNFTAGGSSSGSGAGTAAYLTMVSVGSETSGSLIAPASWNGVVGMYPGEGVVDGTGVIPLFENNDSAGPIGRSVTDVATLLGALDTKDVDYTAGLDANALEGVKVGFLKASVLANTGNPFENTADNARIAQAIETGLANTGATASPIELTGAASEVGRALGVLLGGSVRFQMLPYLNALGAPVTTPQDLQAYNLADPSRRIPFGQGALDSEIANGAAIPEQAVFDRGTEEYRDRAAASLDAAFADNDVLATVNNYTSAVYATANYPAITVPLSLRANGMPVGVTFIGKPGEEAKLLAYAYAFEQATKARANPDLSAMLTSSQ